MSLLGRVLSTVFLVRWYISPYTITKLLLPCCCRISSRQHCQNLRTNWPTFKMNKPDLVISIDFGTTCTSIPIRYSPIPNFSGTGVAYCNVATGTDIVRHIQKWPGRLQANEDKVSQTLPIYNINNFSNPSRSQPSSSTQTARTPPHIGVSKPKQPKTKAASKTKPANGLKSGLTKISPSKLVERLRIRPKSPRYRR